MQISSLRSASCERGSRNSRSRPDRQEGGAAQDTRDLASEIFQQFASERSAKKMTSEEFKLAVESNANLIEGTLDDLFNDMDTNHDDFIDPD